MQILENVTVYKCEHCNYTDTMLGRMKSHENECLSNQVKQNKNEDKRKIYNYLAIDLINKEIKEFLEKYNLPISSEIEFAKIIIDNSFLPTLELDKSVKSIFDKTKFLLNLELQELRYSKEYLNDVYVNYKIDEIEKYIILKQEEIYELKDKKSELILESILAYLEIKGMKNDK